MTKLYKPLSIFFFLLILSSCSEDDPLPVPLVNFFLDPEVVEVGIPVMFDNLTTNASRYEWDFGDGQIVTDISPTITFTSAGTVTVTLRAFTEDDQVDSLVQNVDILERILTGYVVNVFPTTNGGLAWDPDSAGVQQLPDIFTLFQPVDPNNTSGFLDIIGANIAVGPVGKGVEGITFPNDEGPIVLGDEEWQFFLLDYDGPFDAIDLAPENLEIMIGAEFNPLEAATFKNDQGDGGFITVLLQDNAGNVLDVDFTFELQ